MRLRTTSAAIAYDGFVLRPTHVSILNRQSAFIELTPKSGYNRRQRKDSIATMIPDRLALTKSSECSRILIADVRLGYRILLRFEVSHP